MLARLLTLYSRRFPSPGPACYPRPPNTIAFLVWCSSRFGCCVPDPRRSGLVLAVNLFFYARWGLVYLLLVPLAATCDFFLGRAMSKAGHAVRRVAVCAQPVDQHRSDCFLPLCTEYRTAASAQSVVLCISGAHLHDRYLPGGNETDCELSDLPRFRHFLSHHRGRPDYSGWRPSRGSGNGKVSY